MERYSRAYRDHNSPLTPLTPLSANMNIFKFDPEADEISSSKNLHPFLSLRPKPREFVNIRSKPIESEDAQTFNYHVSERRSKMKTIATTPASEMVHVSQKSSPSATMRSVRVANKENIRPLKLTDINLLSSKSLKKSALKGKFTEKELQSKEGQECDNHALRRKKQRNEIERELITHPKMAIQGEQRQKSKWRKQILKSSPVSPKPLSPRLGYFLTQYGMNRLKEIFQRQEIDMQLFCTLSSQELETLGIENPDDRERVQKAVKMAASFLKHAF